MGLRPTHGDEGRWKRDFRRSVPWACGPPKVVKTPRPAADFRRMGGASSRESPWACGPPMVMKGALEARFSTERVLSLLALGALDRGNASPTAGSRLDPQQRLCPRFD